MGIRAKFNLLLALVAVLGAGLFALASTPLLESLSRDEVVESARIMMESAAGTRKYTAEQIAPLLSQRMQGVFYPQAVSAYAAKANFDVLHARFPEFVYREAALNPTNPEDRATDWEADIINEFRANPQKHEQVSTRQSQLGPQLILARAIVAKPACLECHSAPSAAPKSMLAIYGSQNGFGWKPGEIIGAQFVTVPMAGPLARAAQLRLWFLLTFAAVFVVLFALLNLLLGIMIIRPINQIADRAEAVSLGDVDAPEYLRSGSDEVAKLAVSFNRMRRSLQEALRMLGEH